MRAGDDLVGKLGLKLAVDGAALPEVEEWEEVCWYSDHDVHYLELEARPGGIQVQRQMLVSREEEFVFLADAVVADGAERIEYSGSLPLLGDIRANSSKETNEVRLKRRRDLGLVLPLAMPEWQAEPTAARLALDLDGLSYRDAVDAPRLYAPLFFTFDTRRMKQPLAAPDRRREPRHPATPYRCRLSRPTASPPVVDLSNACPAPQSHAVGPETLPASSSSDDWIARGQVEELIEIESAD